MTKLFFRKLLPDAWVYAGKRFFYHFFSLTNKLYVGPIDKQDYICYDIFKKIIKPNSNCIDIGCNTGQILKPLQQLAPQGQFFAFEPIPYLFHKLVKRFPKVTMYDIALCNEEGKTTFTIVPERPTLSGLKPREGHDNKKYITQQIEVHTNTLDNIIPATTKIDFIKIDVEGAEFEVLKGAEKTIATNKPYVIFEFGGDSSNYYNIDAAQVFQYFETKNMKLNSLEHFLKQLQPFTEQEFVGQFTKGYNYYFIAYA